MPLKVPHTRQFSKLSGGTKGSLHPLKLLLSLLHFCLWMFPQRNRPSNDLLMGVCPREIKPAVAEAGTRDRVDQNWSTRTVMFPGESVSRIPEVSIFSWFSEAQEKLGGEMQEVRGEQHWGNSIPRRKRQVRDMRLPCVHPSFSAWQF